MPHLIEVAFKGNRKEFFTWEHDDPIGPRAAVIVEADRGEDLGRVHAVGDLAARRCAGCAHGCGAGAPARRALRHATADEERRAAELRAQDEEARRRAMEKVKVHGLVMKVSDAEWQFDRKKLTFYFTAERRVDFRALVRDLAATFRTRIELKQIGVRDEARRLTGIGRCGREYCSASWLPELRPVNLQVAKDQRLSLNPSQISGACGRLMCSLRFEHEFYVSARKRFPKEGKVIATARGEEKVVANDIFNDRVTLRGPDGEQRVVPLPELKRELEALSPLAGAEPGAPAGSLEAPDDPVEADAALADDVAPEGESPRAGSGERRVGERRNGDRRAAARPLDAARPPRAPEGAREGGESRPPLPPREPSAAGPPSARPPHERPRPAAGGEDAEESRGPYPGARRRGRRGGRRNRPAGEGPRGDALPGGATENPEG
jgi:cell fate regulator YaaT (PSP1 superfamily)